MHSVLSRLGVTALLASTLFAVGCAAPTGDDETDAQPARIGSSQQAVVGPSMTLTVRNDAPTSFGVRICSSSDAVGAPVCSVTTLQPAQMLSMSGDEVYGELTVGGDVLRFQAQEPFIGQPRIAVGPQLETEGSLSEGELMALRVNASPSADGVVTSYPLVVSRQADVDGIKQLSISVRGAGERM